MHEKAKGKALCTGKVRTATGAGAAAGAVEQLLHNETTRRLNGSYTYRAISLGRCGRLQQERAAARALPSAAASPVERPRPAAPAPPALLATRGADAPRSSNVKSEVAVNLRRELQTLNDSAKT